MEHVKIAGVIASLVIFGVASTPVTPRPASPAGKVVGVILDANDARVPEATVRAKGGGRTREVECDEQGQFELSLPAGTYQITVEAHGFRRFVYSSLEVKSNVTEMINIHLEVAVPRGLVPATP
jgi:hypothetical protein